MNLIADLVKLSLNDNKFIVSADDISKDCGEYFSVDIQNLVSKKDTSIFFPTNISLKDFIYEVENLKFKGVF